MYIRITSMNVTYILWGSAYCLYFALVYTFTYYVHIYTNILYMSGVQGDTPFLRNTTRIVYIRLTKTNHIATVHSVLWHVIVVMCI